MELLYFDFFRLLPELEINTKHRVSVWLENNDSYLMPCQFLEVEKDDEWYKLVVQVLDPDDFVQAKYIGNKFLFGNPAKIIGYGILTKLSDDK